MPCRVHFQVERKSVSHQTGICAWLGWVKMSFCYNAFTFISLEYRVSKFPFCLKKINFSLFSWNVLSLKMSSDEIKIAM